MRNRSFTRPGNSLASEEDITAAEPKRRLMGGMSNINRKTVAYKSGLASRDKTLWMSRQVTTRASNVVRSMGVGTSWESKIEARAMRVRMSNGNVAKDALTIEFEAMALVLQG